MPDELPKPRWLNVIYRVPSKPSTLRVGVWKQAKELGGLALQQSTHLFPDVPRVRLGLSQLRRQAEEGGGSCTILEVQPMDPAQERGFVEELNRLRDDEYAETGEDLEELLRHIDRKVATGRFDRGEIDDARGDLERARSLFADILTRDYFGAPRQEEVRKMLDETQEKLEQQIAGALAQGETDGGPQPKPGRSDAAEAKRGVKRKMRCILGRGELTERLREVLSELDDGTLVVDGAPVDSLPDSAAFEVEYSDRKGRRKLEIEVEW